MILFSDPVQTLCSLVLMGSSLGVILVKKPVHACLFFLTTLLALAALYLSLSAQFIAVMQVLVYAGAILVIFMFVIILFQDAYQQIARHPAKSARWLLYLAAGMFVLPLLLIGRHFIDPSLKSIQVPPDFGSVQAIGRALYLDFFFPFEAVILLFLIALIGALYMGRKEY